MYSFALQNFTFLTRMSQGDKADGPTPGYVILSAVSLIAASASVGVVHGLFLIRMVRE